MLGDWLKLYSLCFTDSSVEINADGKMVREKSARTNLYFKCKLHYKGNSVTKYKLLFKLTKYQIHITRNVF